MSSGLIPSEQASPHTLVVTVALGPYMTELSPCLSCLPRQSPFSGSASGPELPGPPTYSHWTLNVVCEHSGISHGPC